MRVRGGRAEAAGELGILLRQLGLELRDLARELLGVLHHLLLVLARARLGAIAAHEQAAPVLRLRVVVRELLHLLQLLLQLLYLPVGAANTHAIRSAFESVDKLSTDLRK